MHRKAFLLLAGATLGCAATPRADQASRTADLVIAATTDVHGRLRGWDYHANAADPARGLSRVATIVDSLRAANPGDVVLVDAGDLLQGNPLAYVAARVSQDTLSPIVAAMNAMDYDAASVGNHEFNYGLETFNRVAAQAEFPFLAANAYLPDGSRAYPAWRIVERAGVRVGIVGATTPGAMIWDRDNLRGKLTLREIVPEVQKAVDEARAAGAEVVIAVVHSGLTGESSYDTVSTGVGSENVTARIAHEVDGLAAIVFGHSHREVADTIIAGTLLMQPRNWAGSVAVAHLALGHEGGGWRVVGRRGQVIPAAGHEESQAVIAATERAHLETIAYVTSPIGTTPVAWHGDSARVADTPLTDFILEVERRVTGADLSSTAAFSLDAELGPGPITVADLARLYPYDNTLRAIRISGEQLRAYLEQSARYYTGFPPAEGQGIVNPEIPGYNFDIVAGAEYTLDVSRPVGSRVTRLEVKGRPVAPTDSFTLALNNYRQTGGGGFSMLQGAPVVYDEQEEIRQLLIDEVRRRGTLRPEDYFTPNWRMVPGAAVARAYDALRPAGRSSAEGGGTAPRLRIVSTNDFHGALEPRADSRGVLRGGAASVAAAIDSARAGCTPPACEFLLVDGGDMWQGTAVSNLSYGTPVVAYYAAVGYAAAALGNHEFDWGLDTLRARMRGAAFPILGANVRYTDGRDVEWIPNDTIVARGALRIGLIGVALETTASSTKASNVAGLRFDAAAPIVDSTARALRARGADAVVVIAHAGAFCGRGRPECSGDIIDLARETTEPLDAIVAGHTHSEIAEVVRGIPIVQALSSGRAIGIIDVRPGRRQAATPVVRDVYPDSLTPSARIDSLVRRATAAIASRVSRPVATIAGALPRSGEQYALGNLVADAQRWAADADVAVMNNHGIRTDLRAGTVTYGDLFELQPFGNALVAVSVRGAALRSYLEQQIDEGGPEVHVSGLAVRYDPSRPEGSRIVSITLPGGAPIADTAAYRLVLNDYLAGGGPGLPLVRGSLSPPEVIERGDLEALVEYLGSLPQPVVAPAEVRIETVAR